MSEALKGAVIIGQSGGPSSVINASAYGCIRTALDADCITKVYGAYHGIKGVLNDELCAWTKEDPKSWIFCTTPRPPRSAPAAIRWRTRTRTTPITSAFLRSSRSTTSAISSTTAATTPWTPATRSASICRRSATSAASWACPRPSTTTCTAPTTAPAMPARPSTSPHPHGVYQDAHVYDTGMICIVEIMGRHAGWLTAAAALATRHGAGPDLIYLPEVDFDMDKFLADVQAHL